MLFLSFALCICFIIHNLSEFSIWFCAW